MTTEVHVSKTADRRPPFAAEVYRTGAREPAVNEELDTLRSELRREVLHLRTAMAKSRDSGTVATELASLREAIEELTNHSGPRRPDRFGALLRDRAIEGPSAKVLARALRLRAKDAVDKDALTERFREVVADATRVAPWPLQGNDRKTIALVGPTGVGKTTTAAKLAARAVLYDERTVTLVSCDGFRVGAIPQLERFATLLGTEFAVARDEVELRRILSTARTDVVIVDTAGRPPGEEGSAERCLREKHGPHDKGHKSDDKKDGRRRHVVLCMTASIRALDAARVSRTWAELRPDALAITKLDETDAPSGILHAMAAARLPVSILCFGQRVPEDIAPATTGALLDWIVSRRGAPSSRP